MSFDTLEEALANGRGDERPFRCPEHDDSVASASVNITKMVWYCFGCQASGRIDGKKRTPTSDELAAMINPEKAMRLYSPGYLELFDEHEQMYWNERHPPHISYQLQMGQDPITGDATFAVYSPRGHLAGVGRRHITEDKQKRYLYPPRWSAARSLGGTTGTYPALPVLCLVEGMADAAAVWTTGCPGVATYGAGLHAPQIEMLHRYNPKLVLLGFDMDEAGERAVSAAYKLLGRRYELQRVRWPQDDPSATAINLRARALQKAVSRSDYGDVSEAWELNRDRSKVAFRRHIKEDHVTAPEPQASRSEDRGREEQAGARSQAGGGRLRRFGGRH